MMKRVVYIGKDEIHLKSGQIGWLNENEAFVPDGTTDCYVIPVTSNNFDFLEDYE
jgi:hypothetical protein